MSKKRFLLISLLALALALPAAAQVQDYKQIKTPPLHPMTIPEPQRLTLSNGMTVMLLEDHELPVVEAFARIRTGIRHEPAEKAGLATVLGDVLRTGGTKSMTGDQMEDFLEARGARIETDMSEASGSAEMWCLRQDFPDVFKVFADVLQEPGLRRGQDRHLQEPDGGHRRPAQRQPDGDHVPGVRRRWSTDPTAPTPGRRSSRPWRKSAGRTSWIFTRSTTPPTGSSWAWWGISTPRRWRRRSRRSSATGPRGRR